MGIPKNLRTHARTFAWGLLVLAVILVLRLPAFWTPILDVDESQFAGFADWLLAGGKPYISSLDTKPLGIYWFYAAIFWIFGRNNMIAVHAVTALWVGATALVCYLIASEIYTNGARPPRLRAGGSRGGRAGFFAALFYAVFSTCYIPKFISTSIVVVMMLPLSASIYACVVWERAGRMRWMWIAGLLWGIACLFKYQAGINLFVMAIYLLGVRPLATRGSGIRWKEFLAFFAGGVIVGALFAAYLLHVGVWDEFVFWSLAGSGAYIDAGVALTDFWRNVAGRGGGFMASTLLIWVLSAAAAWRLARGREGRPVAWLVLLWLALSAAAACTGGKFYGHYFMQLMPALCILAGGVAARLKRAALIAAIVGMAVPAAGFFAARVYADRIYAAAGEEDPNAYRPIAEYIAARTNEDDTIFVWGFASPVYTFSSRLGASRFLWCDWLTGRISGTPSAKDPEFDTSRFITPGSWELFFEDMERNKPVYFVDTSPGNHHDYGKYPVSRYPALAEILARDYALEARVGGADIYRRTRP